MTWFRRTHRPDEMDDRVREIAMRRARAVVKPVQKRVAGLEAAVPTIRVDLDRIAHQLRAIEERLDLARVDRRPDEDGASELDLVRQEHARIRVRLQLVSQYEERIRRLEEVVTALHGGDLRGPGGAS